MRFQMLIAQTTYFKIHGGILDSHDTTELRKEAHEKSARRLARLWPEYGEMGENRMSKRVEFKRSGRMPLKVKLQ